MLHLRTKCKFPLLICHFTRVNSHPIMVQIHKVILGTVAQSQSVQKAVNMKSTIHSHHVYCSSHTHPHVIAYESNSRFMEWTLGTPVVCDYHCVCVPPLILTHSTKQTSNESHDSSAGVELQRAIQKYQSSNEYTKINSQIHTVFVCQKGRTNFIPPTWIRHM